MMRVQHRRCVKDVTVTRSVPGDVSLTHQKRKLLRDKGLGPQTIAAWPLRQAAGMAPLFQPSLTAGWPVGTRLEKTVGSLKTGHSTDVHKIRQLRLDKMGSEGRQ